MARNEQLDRPNSQTYGMLPWKCCIIFKFCHKDNSLPMRPIQSKFHSTNVLHGWATVGIVIVYDTRGPWFEPRQFYRTFIKADSSELRLMCAAAAEGCMQKLKMFYLSCGNTTICHSCMGQMQLV